MRGALAPAAAVAMRRFLRRKGSQLVDPPAEPEPELPCIVEAVEKLAAEIEGTQDILGKLQRACEEEQQNADCPLAAPSEPKPPGTTAFHIGQHVIVRGLQTATEHNGKVGEIESFRCEAHPDSIYGFSVTLRRIMCLLVVVIVLLAVAGLYVSTIIPQ